MSWRLSALTVLLVAAGCRGAEPPEPPVDRGLIQIAADSIAVETGPVGEPKWRSQATYALVEARNGADRDVMVTLGGALRGADGASWPVRRESLRVPAGGTRLFALVDAEQAERPATGAAIEVVGAMAVRYPPPFAITDGNVVLDQDRAVAAGYLINTAERNGSAVVIGAFFDAAGAPVKRMSSVMALSPGGRRGVRLVGPPGSRSAYLFVGEVHY